MNWILPTFIEFAKMLKEKIIQTILNDIFYHIVPTVFSKKNCEARQVTIGKRLLISVFQYFNSVGYKLCVKLVTQFFIKCIIQIILNHFFSKVCPTSFVT